MRTLKRMVAAGLMAASLLVAPATLSLTNGGLALGAAPAAYAVQNNGSGEETTREDLEKAGYKCEVVSVGFVECTKKGSPTYWCSKGVCAPAPAAPPSSPRRPARIPTTQITAVP